MYAPARKARSSSSGRSRTISRMNVDLSMMGSLDARGSGGSVESPSRPDERPVLGTQSLSGLREESVKALGEDLGGRLVRTIEANYGVMADDKLREMLMDMAPPERRHAVFPLYMAVVSRLTGGRK